MTEESKDCWQCRLISGGALVGAGIYVIHQAKNLKGFSRTGVKSIGYGLGGIGLLRLFALPPFNVSKESNKKLITH